MFPLKDNIGTRNLPVVTIALIIANVVVFFLSIRNGGSIWNGPDADTVVKYGAIPYEFTHPGKECDLTTVGDVVCQGSTVTLSGEAGAPAASSNEFPIGTQLKVTNLDNNKSTTVEVTGASGSCALLNNAAFEQVREPGKFLIRRAKIERVG